MDVPATQLPVPSSDCLDSLSKSWRKLPSLLHTSDSANLFLGAKLSRSVSSADFFGSGDLHEGEASVNSASKPSKPFKPSKGEGRRGGFEAPSEGSEAPFSLSLEGFEAFLSFEAFETPFVLLLKAFEGFQGGFEALKGGFATFVWFHFLLISFSSFLTPKSVLVWLSPFFVWRERWRLVQGVCLVSFSSYLFFCVFNHQKRSRVAFLLSFGENVGF